MGGKFLIILLTGDALLLISGFCYKFRVYRLNFRKILNIPHKRKIVFNSTDDELVKQNNFHLLKGIILEVEPVEGQIFSNNFLQEKKDGSQRVILNLKYLNETIDKVHLKWTC